MSAGSDRRRPTPPRLIWWLLLALGIVVIVGWAFFIKRFDDDLTVRAKAALRDAEIAVDVHFDGRHGYLTGSLEYEEDIAAAVAVVDQLEGVAHVYSAVSYLVAGGRGRDEPVITTPPSTSPAVTIRVQEGVVLLRGNVPSQAVLDAILLAAFDAFTPSGVISELRVDEGLETPVWVTRLPEVMASLADLPEGSVVFGTEGASISGTVKTDAAKSAIGEAVAAAVDPLIVNNRIDVVVPVDPSLLADGAAGIVTLQGVMPDQAAIDRIVAGAEDAYGAGNVVNEMTIEAGAVDAAWIELAPGLFARTVGLDPWEIEIGDGSLSVFGRGPADGTVETAIDSFAELGDLLTVDTGGLEVSATAVARELTDLLEGSATFESGSATLSAEATDLLDRAIALLLANPSTVLVVEGHTDSQGSDELNLALSQERAEAVVAYLVEGGVGEGRLTAIGYGETQPIATNDTPEGRAQNRRIEFIVEGGND